MTPNEGRLVTEDFHGMIDEGADSFHFYFTESAETFSHFVFSNRSKMKIRMQLVPF